MLSQNILKVLDIITSKIPEDSTVFSKKKKVVKFLNLTIKEIRNEKLKRKIQKDFDECVRELLRIAKEKLRKLKNDKAQKKTDMIKSGTAESYCDAPEDREFCYNLYFCKRKGVNESKIKSSDENAQHSLWRLYLSKSMPTIDTDSELNEILSKSTNDSEDKRTWIARLRVLCDGLHGKCDTNSLRLVMEYFNQAFAEVAAQTSKPKKMLDLVTHCQTFLRQIHIHYKNINKEFEGPSKYEDYIAAILATFIDVCLDLFHSDDQACPVTGKRLCSLTQYLLTGRRQYLYDVILQLENVKPDDGPLILQLARSALERKPDQNNCLLYTKYTMCARLICEWIKQDTGAIMQRAMSIPAPSDFLTWLELHDKNISEYLPITKHFSGVAVTHFLLIEADNVLLQKIIDILGQSAYIFKSASDETNNKPDETGGTLFVIDTAPDLKTVEKFKDEQIFDSMQTEKMFNSVKAENAEIPMEVEESNTMSDVELESDEYTDSDTEPFKMTDNIAFQILTGEESEKLDILEQTELALSLIPVTVAADDEKVTSMSDIVDNSKLVSNEDISRRKDLIENSLTGENKEVETASTKKRRRSKQNSRSSTGLDETDMKLDELVNSKRDEDTKKMKDLLSTEKTLEAVDSFKFGKSKSESNNGQPDNSEMDDISDNSEECENTVTPMANQTMKSKKRTSIKPSNSECSLDHVDIPPVEISYEQDINFDEVEIEIVDKDLIEKENQEKFATDNPVIPKKKIAKSQSDKISEVIHKPVKSSIQQQAQVKNIDNEKNDTEQAITISRSPDSNLSIVSVTDITKVSPLKSNGSSTVDSATKDDLLPFKKRHSILSEGESPMGSPSRKNRKICISPINISLKSGSGDNIKSTVSHDVVYFAEPLQSSNVVTSPNTAVTNDMISDSSFDSFCSGPSVRHFVKNVENNNAPRSASSVETASYYQLDIDSLDGSPRKCLQSSSKTDSNLNIMNMESRSSDTSPNKTIEHSDTSDMDTDVSQITVRKLGHLDSKTRRRPQTSDSESDINIMNSPLKGPALRKMPRLLPPSESDTTDSPGAENQNTSGSSVRHIIAMNGSNSPSPVNSTPRARNRERLSEQGSARKKSSMNSEYVLNSFSDEQMNDSTVSVTNSPVKPYSKLFKEIITLPNDGISKMVTEMNDETNQEVKFDDEISLKISSTPSKRESVTDQFELCSSTTRFSSRQKSKKFQLADSLIFESKNITIVDGESACKNVKLVLDSPVKAVNESLPKNQAKIYSDLEDLEILAQPVFNSPKRTPKPEEMSPKELGSRRKLAKVYSDVNTSNYPITSPRKSVNIDRDVEALNSSKKALKLEEVTPKKSRSHDKQGKIASDLENLETIIEPFSNSPKRFPKAVETTPKELRSPKKLSKIDCDVKSLNSPMKTKPDEKNSYRVRSPRKPVKINPDVASFKSPNKTETNEAIPTRLSPKKQVKIDSYLESSVKKTLKSDYKSIDVSPAKQTDSENVTPQQRFRSPRKRTEATNDVLTADPETQELPTKTEPKKFKNRKSTSALDMAKTLLEAERQERRHSLGSAQVACRKSQRSAAAKAMEKMTGQQTSPCRRKHSRSRTNSIGSVASSKSDLESLGLSSSQSIDSACSSPVKSVRPKPLTPEMSSVSPNSIASRTRNASGQVLQSNLL